MRNKISKIQKLLFLIDINLSVFIFSLKFIPEYILEEIADEFFFIGQKYNANRIWSILKEREEKRLNNAKYYVISDKGIYAFGEFLSRIDIVFKSMELDYIKKRPLKIYLHRKNVPCDLFLEMIADKVQIIDIPNKINYNYIKYILDKKFILRPALLNIRGFIYHNSDFFPHLIGLSKFNNIWQIPAKFKEVYSQYLSKLIPNNLIYDKKIVILHIPETTGIHTYRNVKDPDNYIDSAKYLISHGYYVIRIGRIANAPFPNLGENYIDISLVEDKPNGFDVYLLSIAHFNILGSSGPNWVYYLFNKPSILTNTFPLHHTGLLPSDIFLPKKIAIDGIEISLRKMLKFGFDSPHVSSKINCIIIENTSEDILNATKEMLRNISNQKTVHDNNQLTYKEIIEKHLRLKTGGFISSYFIKHNLHLLK